MTKCFLVCLFAISLCGASYPQKQVAGRLDILLNGNPVGVCTTWAISERELVTAAHCAKDIETTLAFEGEQAFPVLVDETTDVAILWIERHNLKVLKLANESPRPTIDKVYAVGCPLGFCLSRTDGYLAGSWKGYTTFAMAATGGYSGSPILNQGGQVVGMISAGIPAYHHITLSVTLKNLRQYL